jgi:hypothetical protein
MKIERPTADRAKMLEDAEDLAAFTGRTRERRIPFERAIRDLRRRGES